MNGGRYSADPLTRWHPDGRTMMLEESFEYRDPAGTTWIAERGATVDGASIPRLLWAAVGGPLEGLYRNASIIHDVYCDSMARSWEATHRVWYDGMITSGVGQIEATIKYYAVHRFGPRWDAGGRRYRLAPSSGDKSLAPPDTIALDTPIDDAARLSGEAEQRAEIERVGQRIEREALGPEDVPVLSAHSERGEPV